MTADSHETRDSLHGITVVVQVGDTVHVGKCHKLTDEVVLLQNGDVHSEGEDGLSNADYLARTAKLGVWSRHEQIVVPTHQVQSIKALKDYFARPGREGIPAAELTPLSTVETRSRASGLNNGEIVQLSDSAVEEVKRLLADDEMRGRGLRLAVTGGGCSGMVYKIDFDTAREGDLVIPCAGFEMLLDPKSAIYLRGVTLDHESGLSGRGFQFNNPNASNTCGCGESFAV